MEGHTKLGKHGVELYLNICLHGWLLGLRFIVRYVMELFD